MLIPEWAWGRVAYYMLGLSQAPLPVNFHLWPSDIKPV